jgi:hypothetical protein
MDERQHEYDRFGPWAIEVSTDDPPPPLFRPYLTRPEPALFSIKIPRHIERRNAHPGMDLYDYLVSLYEDDMSILQRVGREVRAETFRYEDVQYLRVEQDLLRGNVRLGLPGRPCDLPYNTVSDDLMRRVVETVRQRYARPQQLAVPGPELQLDEETLSFYFDRLLADERRRTTDMRLLAAQATVAVADGGVHPARRLLFSIASKRLLESMHLTDGRELKIVDRGGAYAYRWQAVYGVATCHIPIANLRGVAWQDDARHAATVLTLETSGGTSFHVFSRDNPSIEPYAAWLSRLAGDPRAAASAPPLPNPA